MSEEGIVLKYENKIANANVTREQIEAFRKLPFGISAKRDIIDGFTGKEPGNVHYYIRIGELTFAISENSFESIMMEFRRLGIDAKL